MPTLSETLAAFCADSLDPRTALHKPMRHGGYLYATNAHIAVRVPDDRAVEAGDVPYQNLLSFFEHDPSGRTWHAVPEINPDDYDACTQCGGLTFVRTCPVCDGVGEFERRGHWVECSPCAESGLMPCESQALDARRCPDCSGSGIARADFAKVAGLAFAARYLWLIGQHFRSAEISAVASPEPYHNGLAIWRSGDTLGVLMPVHIGSDPSEE